MAKYKAKQLLKLYESHGKAGVDKFLAEAAAQGKTSLRDWSLKDLAHTFLGESTQAIQAGLRGESLRESGQAVHSSIFSNITGQLLFSTIKEQFDLPGHLMSDNVPTVQSRIAGTEKVPSITNMGDVSEVVAEGQEYPSVGIGEEYVTWPAKVKRGMKIEVTEESIFFDLTSQIESAAARVGQWLAIKKEKDLIDLLTGNTNTYSRNGTANNTYLTSGAYINKKTSVALVDWTDVEDAEQLLREILDPTTGEPISRMGPRDLIVMPRKHHTAKRILNATNTRSGTDPLTEAPNPLDSYRLLTSDLLYQRTLATVEPTAGTAQGGWWLGDLARTFAWIENWPLAVFQQGKDGPQAFDRDVAMVFKARYRGVGAVVGPRNMVKMEDTAW